MAAFLMVKEAAKLVGKSPSSIRRIIYPILEQDGHPDRKFIEPTPEEAQSLRMKGENFPWRISEELLRREIPADGAKPAAAAKSQATAGGEHAVDLIDMLRRELDIKNHQIETQAGLLKDLSERLREGNILMGSLQRQLALGDGSAGSPSEVVDANTDATAPEKGSVEAPIPKPQKWLFGLLSRR